MFSQAVLRQFIILGAWHSIIGIGPNANATSGRKDARHLNIFGVHELYEIFHDDIHTVFVKVAMVTETKEIELQALALYHALGWNVSDAYFGKIRLPRDGTQGGELRSVESHPVVVVGMFIVECLQHLGGIISCIRRGGT